jgi:ABC-2 type transport system permease protein
VASFLAFLGPAANLPDAIVWLSPFHHLGRVPAESLDIVSTALMVGAGLALGAVGFVVYARRDLQT